MRIRNTTVLVPLWSGSVERSNRANAFPKIHEDNQYILIKFQEMVTCLCTCVRFSDIPALITTIGEYMLQSEPLHALFSNDV